MKRLITFISLLGFATGGFILIGAGTASAKKVANAKADVTVCQTLESLIIAKEIPSGSALPSDCRVLKKGTWWGIVLVDLIESSAEAEQIAIPLTGGGTMKVWAPASQLYTVYDR